MMRPAVLFPPLHRASVFRKTGCFIPVLGSGILTYHKYHAHEGRRGAGRTRRRGRGRRHSRSRGRHRHTLSGSRFCIRVSRLLPCWSSFDEGDPERLAFRPPGTGPCSSNTFSMVFLFAGPAGQARGCVSVLPVGLAPSSPGPPSHSRMIKTTPTVQRLCLQWQFFHEPDPSVRVVGIFVTRCQPIL